MPKAIAGPAGHSRGRVEPDNTALFAIVGLVFTPLSVVALLRTRSWNWIRMVSIVGIVLLVLESYVFLTILRGALALLAHG